MTHVPVTMPPGCPSLDGVYGTSVTQVIWLPQAETGQALWAQAKQTEAERQECRKRGAE